MTARRDAELEQQRLAGLRGGIRTDLIPDGVSAASAFRAAELDLLPKRTSVLEDALAGNQLTIHPIRVEEEE